MAFSPLPFYIAGGGILLALLILAVARYRKGHKRRQLIRDTARNRGTRRRSLLWAGQIRDRDGGEESGGESGLGAEYRAERARWAGDVRDRGREARNGSRQGSNRETAKRVQFRAVDDYADSELVPIFLSQHPYHRPGQQRAVHETLTLSPRSQLSREDVRAWGLQLPAPGIVRGTASHSNPFRVGRDRGGSAGGESRREQNDDIEMDQFINQGNRPNRQQNSGEREQAASSSIPSTAEMLRRLDALRGDTPPPLPPKPTHHQPSRLPSSQRPHSASSSPFLHLSLRTSPRHAPTGQPHRSQSERIRSPFRGATYAIAERPEEEQQQEEIEEEEERAENSDADMEVGPPTPRPLSLAEDPISDLDVPPPSPYDIQNIHPLHRGPLQRHQAPYLMPAHHPFEHRRHPPPPPPRRPRPSPPGSPAYAPSHRPQSTRRPSPPAPLYLSPLAYNPHANTNPTAVAAAAREGPQQANSPERSEMANLSDVDLDGPSTTKDTATETVTRNADT
ncbi:MAG: hypothetical protein M1819_006340 [Sarea resinae]|nr:MAG: hypothetical protein M1819_006340 [Sarea resinae]